MTGPYNGDVVFEIAKHRRMTNTDLSKEFHIDESTISRIKNKHRNFTKIEEIAICATWELPTTILFPYEAEIEGVA